MAERLGADLNETGLRRLAGCRGNDGGNHSQLASGPAPEASSRPCCHFLVYYYCRLGRMLPPPQTTSGD